MGDIKLLGYIEYKLENYGSLRLIQEESGDYLVCQSDDGLLISFPNLRSKNIVTGLMNLQRAIQIWEKGK